MMACITLQARKAVFALLFASVALTARAEQTAALRVFAAASLTEVLQDIAADYTMSGAPKPVLSFAASSALARQIEAGAPADVFISADEEWMDYLAARDLIRTTSRRPIAGNRLALIAPAGSTVDLRLVPGVDFVAALHGGLLATADPDSVPAGRYARSALMSLDAWAALADRLARAENVRMALAYVARGEAPLGIVYATDAQTEPRVRVLGLFPDDTHLPILYPGAALRDAPAEADDFLRFLAGPQARERLHHRGFTTVPAPAEASR
jgi:molybdate transport system substrate-binding protein